MAERICNGQTTNSLVFTSPDLSKSKNFFSTAFPKGDTVHRVWGDLGEMKEEHPDEPFQFTFREFNIIN